MRQFIEALGTQYVERLSNHILWHDLQVWLQDDEHAGNILWAISSIVQLNCVLY